MDKETIAHVAALSQLRLTEEESVAFASDLSSILRYVSELNAVDTMGVEVTTRAAELINVFRDDTIVNEKDPAQVAELVNAAPDKENGYIKVKAIL